MRPKPGKTTRQFLREIEAELIERGLTQYLVVARRSKKGEVLRNEFPNHTRQPTPGDQ
jgi:hypothetical protein